MGSAGRAWNAVSTGESQQHGARCIADRQAIYASVCGSLGSGAAWGQIDLFLLNRCACRRHLWALRVAEAKQLQRRERRRAARQAGKQHGPLAAASDNDDGGDVTDSEDEGSSGSEEDDSADTDAPAEASGHGAGGSDAAAAADPVEPEDVEEQAALAALCARLARAHRLGGRVSAAFDGDTFIFEKHEGLDAAPAEVDFESLRAEKRHNDCRALQIDPELADRKRRAAEFRGASAARSRGQGRGRQPFGRGGRGRGQQRR
ncbi:hypothetical protein MNEG_11700 [Monoraphidium neglectum]|jgi:hypothetical protein|uniref:Uncharacterized protein n=1 Tax=Monoraphidium neglectum TaxID=145388 RepID=A0A0D2LXY3_9CHLO|nr:hypothetical protein MNEG_11700 [Monoraphidium neglectum]KIY96264.1 hypothetical protein MNEG_11700 [Monoraphidium neglectum]|eukprot:XP_013895284.1 hypothetical protein MNEG_11700 [Monoraphidium neglectum]